jgi:predicted protein tyrosine phosphatase
MDLPRDYFYMDVKIIKLESERIAKLCFVILSKFDFAWMAPLNKITRM